MLLYENKDSAGSAGTGSNPNARAREYIAWNTRVCTRVE
jgi:hypothetical protein